MRANVIELFVYNTFPFFGMYKQRVTVLSVMTCIWISSIVLIFINKNCFTIAINVSFSVLYYLYHIAMITYDCVEIERSYYDERKNISKK